MAVAAHPTVVEHKVRASLDQLPAVSLAVVLLVLAGIAMEVVAVVVVVVAVVVVAVEVVMVAVLWGSVR